MNVDTGFVYGFDQVETSGQIDILVWDARHPPVYRLSEFVIVPPEAVVAAVSVKTNMERADIESGIENLATLIQLDVQFRARASLPPIAKILATFHGPKSPETALETIGRSCQALFAESSLAEAVVPALRDFDPFEPMQEHKWAVTRVLPGLFASLDSDSVSYCQGWGPPRASGYDRHGPVGLRRVPWVYRQGHAITTPIEKVVYRVLEACYLATGLAPGAMLSAWADLNPLAHVRSGDAEEIQEEHGFPMLDAEAIELPAEGSDLT
jgi:hypothetical protein